MSQIVRQSKSRSAKNFFIVGVNEQKLFDCVKICQTIKTFTLSLPQKEKGKKKILLIHSHLTSM